MEKLLRRMISLLLVVAMIGTPLTAFADDPSAEGAITEEGSTALTTSAEEAVEEEVYEVVEEEVYEVVEEGAPAASMLPAAGVPMTLGLGGGEIALATGNLDYNAKTGELIVKGPVTAADMTAEVRNAITLTFAAGVTAVPEGVFTFMPNLRVINIPYSVASIPVCAFEGDFHLNSIVVAPANSKYMSQNNVLYVRGANGPVSVLQFPAAYSLSSLEIPETVTRIEANAFDGASMLQSVTLPEKLEYIGVSAFRGCSALESIEVPAKVTGIPASAFEDCFSLTSVELPAGLTSIGVSAFENCSNLQDIVIPAGIGAIKERTFAGCTSLTEINIPAKVSNIGEAAFAGCTNLRSISIPAGVTVIKKSTFENCSSLNTVSIPASVTSIKANAFYGCRGLIDVDYSGSDAQWSLLMSNTASGNEMLQSLKNFYPIQTGYSITYVLNGGTNSVENPNSYLASQLPIPLKDATKKGYTFLGWYTDSGVKVTELKKDTTGNLTLTAKWQVDAYTVTYVLNGGQKPIDYPIFYATNTVFDISKVSGAGKEPVRDGYTFAGWFLDAKFTKTADTANLTAAKKEDGNITLYAKWNAIVYTVRFLDEDGKAYKGLGDLTFTADNTLKLPVPAKAGFEFMGWTVVEPAADKGRVLDTIPVGTVLPDASKPMKLQVCWYNEQYPITYYLPDGADLLGNDYPLYYTEKDIIELDKLTKPEMKGYTFDQWYLNSNYTQPIHTIHDRAGKLFLYGKFNVNVCTIQFNSNGGNPVPSMTYDINSNVWLPIPERDGYIFDGWKVIKSSNPALDLSNDLFLDQIVPGVILDYGNVQLEAQWVKGGYTVYFHTSGGTIEWQGDTIVNYNTESNYSLAIGGAYIKNATRPGYKFDGWYIDSDHTQKIDAINGKVYSGDLEIWPKWTPVTYKLTLKPNNGEDPWSKTFNVETSVALYVPEWEGHTFLGWFDADGNLYTSIEKGTFLNEGVTTLVLNGVWDADQFNITYVLNGGENNTKNPASVPANTTVTLYDAKRANATFLGWFTEPELKHQIHELEDLTSDITLYAAWETKEHIAILHYNDGVTADFSFSYSEDARTTLPKPTRDGYTFDGWKIKGSSADPIKVIAKGTKRDPLELEAQWTAKTYNIVYKYRNGTAPAHPDLTYKTDVAVNLDAANNIPTRAGYYFAGWYLENTFETPIHTTAGQTGKLVVYANWSKTKNVWTATLKYPDGSSRSIAFGSDGLRIRSFYNASQVGYTFKNWVDEDGNKYDNSTTYKPMHDVVLEPEFELKNYAVKFATNGGSSLASVTFNVEMEKDLPVTTKIGANLKGWYTDAACASDKKVEKISMKDAAFAALVKNTSGSSMTLYAGWTTQSYTLTLDDGDNVTTKSFDYGDAITLPPASPKAGYKFLGWYDSDDNKVEVVENVAHDLTLTAKWEAIEYSIDLKSEGGILNAKHATKYTVDAVVNLMSIKNTPFRPGYIFDGWYTEQDGKGTKVTNTKNLTGDLVLYAKWIPIYTITFDPAGGDMENKTAEFDAKTVLDLTKSPYVITRDGYRFLGWFKDLSSTTPIKSTEGIEGNITVVAHWEKIYKIAYNPNGGTMSGSQDTTYLKDAPISLTTSNNKPTKAGAIFTGWFKKADLSEASRIETTSGQTGDLTLYAGWYDLNYVITYDVAAGHYTLTNPDYSFSLSKVVDLTASQNIPTKAGYTFLGWYKNPEYTGSAVTTTSGLSGNLNLYAKWGKNITITLHDIRGSVDSPKTLNMIVGTNATLPIPTGYADHDFQGWFTNAEGTGSKISNMKDLQDDIDLYAKWTATENTIFFINSDTGAEVYATKYSVNGSVTWGQILTKEGYTCQWYKNAACTDGPYNSSVGFSGNVTLYSKWV